MGPLYAVENIQKELKNSVKNVNFQLSRSRLKTQFCFFNYRIFDYKSLLTSLILTFLICNNSLYITDLL